MTARCAHVLIAVLIACGCGPKVAPVVTAGPPPPTDTQKLTWILQLEDERVARGDAPGQDLVVMLADQGAHIRRRAALALGRAQIAEAVPALSGMLATEPDPEVRQMAAFALGLIGDAVGGAGADHRAGRSPIRSSRDGPPKRSASSATRPRRRRHRLDDRRADHRRCARRAGARRRRLSEGRDDRGRAPRASMRWCGSRRTTSWRRRCSTPSGQPRSRWWPVAFAFQRVGNPACRGAAHRAAHRRWTGHARVRREGAGHAEARSAPCRRCRRMAADAGAAGGGPRPGGAGAGG